VHIGLISYEYAGEPAAGGIGTYVRNAAQMLARRGHQVEVYTSGRHRRSLSLQQGLTVHSLPSTREVFGEQIAPIFGEHHRRAPFDVIEGPEYGAEAASVASAFPDLPLVVKLHGPSFTIANSNACYVSWATKARFFSGSLARGRIPNNPWRYNPRFDIERLHAAQADELAANSCATAERVARAWNFPLDRISRVPLVFNSSTALERIRVETTSDTVLFLGRLEVRKGVIELAKAIPRVLSRKPHVRFRFVGRALPHPGDGVSIIDHMKGHIGRNVDRVKFVGGVPYEQVAEELAQSDICVFPSDWEASGFVCMEAMAAGRGVIGSNAGGMAEIIDHGRTGLLVPPRNPIAIANAILALIDDPEKRISMGRAARDYIIKAHSADVIGPLQEATYHRAIEHAHLRGSASRTCAT
jgi:glycogen synthase